MGRYVGCAGRLRFLIVVSIWAVRAVTTADQIVNFSFSKPYQSRKRYPRPHPITIMATEPCDGCGRSVQIAGGVANLWTFGGDESGGLTLEFTDDSEHFLCYDCIDRLPDNPRADDVAALDEQS